MKTTIKYFEPYPDKRKIKNPYISIWGKDKIFLSSQFIEDNKKLLTGMKYCMLLYSNKNKSIGFRFNKNGSASGGYRSMYYKLTSYQDSGIVLTCNNFFRYYELDSDKLSGRYVPCFIPHEKKEKMLVIYLKERMEFGE